MCNPGIPSYEEIAYCDSSKNLSQLGLSLGVSANTINGNVALSKVCTNQAPSKNSTIHNSSPREVSCKSNLGESSLEFENPYHLKSKQITLSQLHTHSVSSDSELRRAENMIEQSKETLSSPTESTSNVYESGIPKVSCLKVKDESGLTRVVKLTAEKIRSLYYLPQPQAAKVLGIGLSTLKKHARILLPNERWPNPKQRDPRPCNLEDYKINPHNSNLKDQHPDNIKKTSDTSEISPQLSPWDKKERCLRRERSFDSISHESKRQKLDSITNDNISRTYSVDAIPPKLRMKYQDSFHSFTNNSPDFQTKLGMISSPTERIPFPMLPDKRRILERRTSDYLSELSEYDQTHVSNSYHPCEQKTLSIYTSPCQIADHSTNTSTHTFNFPREYQPLEHQTLEPQPLQIKPVELPLQRYSFKNQAFENSSPEYQANLQIDQQYPVYSSQEYNFSHDRTSSASPHSSFNTFSCEKQNSPQKDKLDIKNLLNQSNEDIKDIASFLKIYSPNANPPIY